MIKRIDHAGISLAWFLYGEGKPRVDHVAVDGQNMGIIRLTPLAVSAITQGYNNVPLATFWNSNV
jgi:hypothetical protein